MLCKARCSIFGAGECQMCRRLYCEKKSAVDEVVVFGSVLCGVKGYSPVGTPVVCV